MILKKTAIGYATGLFDVESSVEELYAREKFLRELSELIRDYPQIQQIISCPEVSSDYRVAILEKLLDTKLDVLSRNFIKIILKTRKTPLLASIASEYHKLVVGKLKTVDIQVNSVDFLREETHNLLRNRLESKLDKNVVIEESKDPSLVAGSVLFIGNQLLDLSIKGQIEKLKKQLLKAET